jgi:hypothetical protein
MSETTQATAIGGGKQMAELIKEQNLSRAWLRAVETLQHDGGKAVHLCVAIDNPGVEDAGIRKILNTTLARENEQAVITVANTIFPSSLYLPEKLGDKAAAHFYEHSALFSRVAGRHKDNRCGRYIDRMLKWDGCKGSVNQLEVMVQILKRELANPNTKSSRYEMAFSTPEDHSVHGGDLRIQQPDYDRKITGFPCLSHISFTLKQGKLNLAAMYRNQHFFRKAYGNYVGLSRLMRFLCTEAGCELGELLCIATHADAELGVGKLKQLIEACHGLEGQPA